MQHTAIEKKQGREKAAQIYPSSNVFPLLPESAKLNKPP